MFKTKKEQSVATASLVSDVAAGNGAQYTSGDVARIAGVSLRQLQWWDERNGWCLRSRKGTAAFTGSRRSSKFP